MPIGPSHIPPPGSPGRPAYEKRQHQLRIKRLAITYGSIALIAVGVYQCGSHVFASRKDCANAPAAPLPPGDWH